MNATKTSFQEVNGVLTEWVTNGAKPALKWVDPNNNDWRVIAAYQFDNVVEVYTIVVTKQLKLNGTSEWVNFSQYDIVAGNNNYRVLNTGVLVDITDEGNYDGVSNTWPAASTRVGGAINAGDKWTLSVEGTFKGNVMPVGTTLLALIDAPGQTDANWAFEIPDALDVNGNIVAPTGWVTNSKYYTIMIGYNAFNATVSINYFVYLQMADREGLTIV